MIPILFASSETTFTSNGIGRLADARTCEVTEERNGSYELVLEYPVTGPLMSSIVPGAYIYATHDDHKTPQAFEIYQVSAPLEGFVKVNAWHISYALNSILVKPFTAGSCTSALAAIPTNSVNTNNFTFWTDKSVTATYTLTEPKSARAILGGTENSILDVYGKGEYEFDMLTVKLYVNRGANRDVTIRYGKNLKSLDQTLDASNVFNAVLPYWTNGETTVYATSLVVKTGQTANRAIVLDMSSDFTEEPTLAQLTAAAQTFVDSTDNYQVKENIKIDFVQLWQTEEYKNVANLQRVYLCDTVKIYYEKLGINATAKVIKVVYDTLLERYVSMELGEPRVSLAQQIQADVSESILAEVPSRSVMQGAIDHATQLITGGSGGYIKYHYAGDGTPTEMLIMDTADESTATNIIRLNQNGIGFSNDGGSTYTSAWTIDGNFVADFITTGNLDADLLTVGRIQDSSGVNYWDLDTGDFQTQRGTIADFTISTDELLNGTVGVHSYGTSIKAGTLAMSNWKPYHVGGGVYENYTTKMVENHAGLQFTFFKDADSTFRNMGGIDTDVAVINTDVYPYLLFGRSAAGMKVFTNDYVGSKLVFSGTANFASNVTLASSALLTANGGIAGGAMNYPADINMYGSINLTKTTGVDANITAGGYITATQGFAPMITADVLGDALSIPASSCYMPFACTGSSYTGASGAFPNNNYNYGYGFISKRNSQTTVVCFAESGDLYPPIYNCYYNGWKGWRSVSLMGKYTPLATFTGTTSTTVTLSQSILNFQFLLIRVLDSDGAIVNGLTIPVQLAQINTYKLYGSSSSMWGSVEFTGSATTAVFNRTSANTTSVLLGGLW